MRSYKLVNIFVMLFLLVSPLFAGGSQALAGVTQTSASQPAQSWTAYPNDEIGGTNSGTGQMRTTTQAMREAAAYQNKQAQYKTNLNIAGVQKNTNLISPLSADSIAPLATMNPLGKPDYFGNGNYANSPLPQLSTSNTLVAGTGMRKFVDTLPGLCGVTSANGNGTNNLGQCLPIAVPDTTTFPGSDYYEIALVQYTEQLHSDLPPTLIRGYVQVETPVIAGTGKSQHVTLANVASPNGQGAGAIIDKNGAQVYGVSKIQYFGPVIIASGCDPTATNPCTPRPVRVKFTNYLPTGSGGDLFIPYDTTYMGAGMGPGGSIYSISVTNGGAGYTSVPTVTLSAPPTATPANVQATGVASINNGQVVSILVTNGGTGYTTAPTVSISGGGATTNASAVSVLAGQPGEMYTQNRATLHLHGGNTPWISDGTPHQWTAPVGEVTSYQKGDSVGYVPDMWFDGNGNLISACAGQLTCSTAGSSNNPGNGILTFYWTNQQSGRLMFYHDHSYGETRLNVYAGEAAGYMIVDQNQENALAALGIPGTLGTTPDLAHLVPLVIQDKTFVPDNGVTGGQLANEDPTWSVAQYGGTGNLWLPHVYMPNQNPSDVTGANAFGRWDYGPWFWPPQDPSTYVAGAQPYSCTSSFYNTSNPGPAFPPLMCPGIPNPTGVMEGFMDTPMVNGTAYPSLTVDPTAYRFQLLNAANDRAWNLQLYVAEPLTIGVLNGGSGYTAVPAVTITRAAGDTTGAGAAATAILSSGAVTSVTITGVGKGYTANPAVTITGDGTGATATATYDPITSTVLSVSVTAIGSGYSYASVSIAPPAGCTTGCLTATAVASITPAGTVLGINVTNPGAGWTLPPVVTIAAAPSGGITATATSSINSEVKMVPAVPPTATSTLKACSQVNPTGGGQEVMALLDSSGQPLNGTGLPANCWPSAWPTDGRDGGVPDPTTAGPPLIVMGAEGGMLPQLAVIPSTPIGYEYNRRSITVLNTYTHGLYAGPAERSDFMIDFSQFAGKTLIVYNDAPAPNPAFDPRDDYYTNDPDQSSFGGAPTTLPGYGPNTRTVMQIKVNAGVGGGAALSSVTVTNGGAGYTAPTATIAAPTTGTQATAVASGTVTGLTLTSAGSGYSNPVVTFSGGGGNGAAASMGSGVISSLALTNSGAGYAAAPTVSFSGGGGSLAAASASGSVDAITLSNSGAGYATMPGVTLAAPPTGGTQATASASGSVDAIAVTSGGGGYAAVPTVTLSAPPVGGTQATASATGGVDAITVGTPGAGYTAPSVALTAPPVGGTQATATATGIVDSLTLTTPGSLYTAPTVTLTAPPAPGVQATATVTGSVDSITVTNPGTSPYKKPVVTITDPNPAATGATATANLDVNGFIASITINTPGTGYTNPSVSITDSSSGTGAGATATATISITTLTLTNPGSGYTSAPAVTFSGATTGTTAVATTTISLTAITVTAAGTGYLTAPSVTITDTGTPVTAAAATATLLVNAITVTAAGSGYTAAPGVSFSSGTAVATATLKVTAIAITAAGSGYLVAPAVTFASGTAAATATLKVTALTLTSPGSGYTTAPTVVFTGASTISAAATAFISATGIVLTAGGTGYTTAPTVTISDTPPGTGSGATAVATLSVNAVSLTNPGSGYTSVPVVTIADTTPGVGTGAAATANLAAGTAFALAPLNAATGVPAVFAVTQQKVIIPEPAFPAANGNGPATYVPIQATSLTAWVGGPIGTITLVSGGAGYTAAPAVTFAGGGGSLAAATATLSPTTIASLTLTNGGSGYTSAPTVAFAGGGGTGAAATAALAPAGVASATVTNQGRGYNATTTKVTFSAPQTLGGTTATGTAVVSGGRITGITITNHGTGYTAAPTITITSTGGGSGARAVATLAPAPVGSITLTSPGSGYTSAPTVSFLGGGGTGAAATAAITPVPVASITVTNGGTGYTSAPTITIAPPQTTGTTATAVANQPVQSLLPKTIQELFTLDYGRMNATLGVEVPFTNFLTQTTIPYGFVDPPTEIFSDGQIQLWKITHNGVDTHFIHFHLFTVQVINRVGWDGMIKPPDATEMGFKDTVRMNPLEDVIIAIHPLKQTLPWQLPDSYRPMDTTEPIGSSLTNQFTGIDPTNEPAAVTNDVINYGYEYIWHCHILSHEEIDMMRNMVFVVPPDAPTGLAPIQVTSTRAVKLTWTDNALNETGFTIQRSITPPTSPSWAVVGTAPAMPGTGGTASFVDTTVAPNTVYWYQVYADNLAGYTQVYAAPAVGYPTLDAPSGPSNNVQVTTNGSANFTPFAVSDFAPYIFASAFQAGTDEWAGVVGMVQTTKAADMSPDGKGLGMVADLSAPQGSFVFDNSPAGITTYNAAFGFDPNGAVSGSDPVDIFVGLDQNGLPAFGIQYQQVMVEAEPVYQVRGWVQVNGDQLFSNWVEIGNYPTRLGLAWASGASKALSLYIDNSLVQTLIGDTSGRQLLDAVLGPSGGLAGASGTMYFDEVTSNTLSGVLYTIYLPQIRQ